MYLLILNLIVALAWADSSPQIVEYKNGSIHFKISKTDKLFSVDDDMGLRTLEIKTCNRSTIEKFWNRLYKSALEVKPKKGISAKQIEKEAWVKTGGNKIPVLNAEPPYKVLNEVNSDVQVMIAESKLLCRK